MRRALLIRSGDHGLQWQITRLHEVPARLGWLRIHVALGVQHGDDQRVAAGAESAFQCRNIQQHPVAYGRRSHEIGVGEGAYLFVVGRHAAPP